MLISSEIVTVKIVTVLVQELDRVFGRDEIEKLGVELEFAGRMGGLDVTWTTTQWHKQRVLRDFSAFPLPDLLFTRRIDRVGYFLFRLC